MSSAFAAIVLLVVLIVFSTHRPPPPKPPMSHKGHVSPSSIGVSAPVQWNEKSESHLGHYQSQLRELRLQLEVIKLLVFRTGKTVPAETMRSISTDMEQLGTLLDHLPWSQPMPERHAAVLAKQLEDVKNRLDAVEKELGLE